MVLNMADFWLLEKTLWNACKTVIAHLVLREMADFVNSRKDSKLSETPPKPF